MNMGEMYRAGRIGMIELGRSLTDAEAATKVAACPAWTIKDVYAHQAGVVADALAGRLDGVATDPWTARQVEERAGKSLVAVLDEWEESVPPFEAFLETGAAPPQVIIDQWSHEQDIRATLARPANRGDERAKFCVEALAGMRGESWQHAPVEVIGDSGKWMFGPGEPKITLRASDYDLARALLGRRSLAQVRAMDWTGDPEPILDHLVVFSYSAEDQPA
jgi:uncharacterized protein (TIGR03083 family)